jgi:hypothetical protein
VQEPGLLCITYITKRIETFRCSYCRGPEHPGERRKPCSETTWVASISSQIVGLRLWTLGEEADPGMLAVGSY